MVLESLPIPPLQSSTFLQSSYSLGMYLERRFCCGYSERAFALPRPHVSCHLFCIYYRPGPCCILHIDGSQLGSFWTRWGRLTMSRDNFCYHNWLCVLLAPSGQRPGRLLNTPQCTGQPPTTQDYPGCNVNSAIKKSFRVWVSHSIS